MPLSAVTIPARIQAVALTVALALLAAAAPAQAGLVRHDSTNPGFKTESVTAFGLTISKSDDREVQLLPPGSFGNVHDTLIAVQLDRQAETNSTQEQTAVLSRSGSTYGTSLADSPFLHPQPNGRTYFASRAQLHRGKASPTTPDPAGTGLIFGVGDGSNPWIATATGTKAGSTAWGGGAYYTASVPIEATVTSVDDFGDATTGHQGTELLTRSPGEAPSDREGAPIGDRCSGNGLCMTPGYTEVDFGIYAFDRGTLESGGGKVCNDKPGGVLVADVDGKDKLDIIHFGVGCGGALGAYGYEVWLGPDKDTSAGGRWKKHSFTKTSGDAMGALRDVAAGNLNDSPGSEIVAVSANGFQTWRWDPTGAGALISAKTVKESNSPGAAGMQVLIDDLSVPKPPRALNARADVAIVRTHADSGIVVFPNTGSGDGVDFATSNQHPEGEPVSGSEQESDARLKTGTDAAPEYWPGRRAVSVGDVDGNGRRDVVAWQRNNVIGTYLQSKAPSLELKLEGRPVRSSYGVERGKEVTVLATVGGPDADTRGTKAMFDCDGNPATGTDGYETTGGSSGNTFNCRATFTENGQVEVRVRATNAGGDVVRGSLTLNVGDPLTAGFSADDTTPQPGDEVTFTALPDGGFPANGVYRYQWSVDDQPVDGATSKTYKRGFPTAGRHAIAVRVSDAEGHALNASPIAGADSVKWSLPLDPRLTAGRTPLSSPPIEAVAGEQVTISAAGTNGGLAPYDFAFDLGDEAGNQGEFEATATADATRTRTWTTPGIKVVRVKVRDGDSADPQSATKSFDVNVRAPLAPGMRAGNRRPSPGETVRFDATSHTSGAERPYSYAWTVDGQPRTDETPDDGLLDVRFDEPRASVPVTVKVTDRHGRTHATPVTETVRVAEPLVHRIVATPAAPDVDEAASFSAATTTGGLRPLRYAWDLDDNGTFERVTGDDPTVGPRSFPSAGDHRIAVRTTEADGEQNVGRLTLRVYDPLAPAIAQSPDQARPGRTVTFDAARIDAGGLGPYTYRWALARDVRDGEEPRYAVISDQTGATFSPSPALDAGKYSVRAEVTDARGRTAETTHDFKVADDLAARIGASNLAPQAGDEVTYTSKTTGGLGPYERLEWHFDADGEPDATGTTAKRSYDEAGDGFEVRLEVTDADGVIDATTLPVAVSRALTASVEVQPARAGVGQQIVFDAGRTFGGQTSYAKYEWLLDGATAPAATTTAATLSRHDLPAGKHAVRVRVTDAQGRTATSESQAFKVADPLVAGIALSNQSPQAGEQFTLDAKPTTGGLTPYATYDWDVDGDGDYDEDAGHASTAKASFAEADTHKVGLRVTDADGETDEGTRPVIVGGALTAAFVRTPAKPRIGEEVTFDAGTTGGGQTPYATYEWFVDGADEPAAQTGPTFKRSFDGGRHRVELRVTDAQGRRSTTDTASFTVADELIARIASSNAKPQVGEPITFKAAPTTGGLAPYATYDWDLDGDGTYDEAAGHAATATKTFNRAGDDHRVGLRVTDADGETDAATPLPVTVSPALTARFERTPGRAAIGETMTFDAATTTGGEGPYTTYEWFLDGADEPEADRGAQLERAFGTAGRHTMRLRVTDQQGRRASTEEREFTVADDLEAALAASPTVPERDEQTTFDAGATKGGLGPFRYAFDLDGDASTGTGGFETGPQDAATAKRSFATTGTKTVRARVTDASGQTSIVRRDIRVVAPLVAAAAATPVAARPGDEVTLSAADTAGGAAPLRYSWAIDGKPAGEDETLRRTFAEPGFHVARVTVTDAAGHRSIALRSFKVAAPLAASLAIAPTRPQAGEALRLTAARTGGVGPFRYAFDLDGDGTFAEPGDAATAGVTYETAGERRPSVKVIDADGTEAVAGTPVQVARTLAARLEARPTLIGPGAETTLDAAETVGGAGPRSYRWDLDGQPGFELDTGATPTAKRTFPDKGRFDVTVEARDEAGHTSTATTTVDVGDRLRAALKASGPPPEVGDTVALTATAAPQGTTRPTTFRFDVDGEPGFETEPTTTPTTRVTLTKAGPLVVAVEATDERGQVAIGREVVSAAEKLVPAFRTKPETPEMGEEVEFQTAPTKGGSTPRRYAWDFDGDGEFEREDSDEAIGVHTFETLGEKKVGLRVTDRLGRIRTITRTVKVVDGCRRSVRVNLAFLETVNPDGCFRRSGTRKEPTYWTTDDVELNHLGLRLPSGTRLTVRMPTEDNPGGRITADNVEIKVMGNKLFNAKVDWTLPDDPTDGGDAAERAVFGGGGMASEAKVLGLKAEGAFRFSLGRDEAVGTAPPEHYVKLRLDAAIPSVKLGPYKDSPGATMRLALRHDREGTRAEAAYGQVQQGFLPASGGIKVEDVCLSYRRAGYLSAEDALAEGPQLNQIQTNPESIEPEDETQVPIKGCAMFSDNLGDAFLTCAVDPTVDNWNGTLDLGVFDFGFAASVGIGGNRLSNMAIKGSFGDTLPIFPEVAYFRSLAAGVCLEPEPLQVRGQGVIGAFPLKGIDEDLVSVGGGFYYRGAYTGGPSSTDDKPWRAELQGDATFLGVKAGKGHFGIDGDYVIDAELKPSLQFPNERVNLVSLDGGFSGFIETRTGRFNVEGRSIRLCIAGRVCQDSGIEALLSSTGAAGCYTLFTVPGIPGLFSSYEFKIGFGAKWGGAPDVMVESCGVGPWRVVRSTRARAAQAGGPVSRSIDVGKNDPVLIVRARGEKAPPKVVVRDPDGNAVVTSTDEKAAQGDKWMLLHNGEDNATQVIVGSPKPGRWTVTPIADEPVVGLDSAEAIPPPTIEATATKTGARQVELDYAYSPQDETVIEFFEMDPVGKSTMRTLGKARPGACATPRKAGPVELKCGKIRFAPTYGPGGKRKIVATVSRFGKPLENRDVATYLAPPPQKAGRVRRLAIVRGKKGVSIVHRGATGAERYELAAVVDDGDRRLVTQKRSRRVRLPKIPKTSGVLVEVSAFDGREMPGPRVRLRLPPRAKSVGPVPKKRLRAVPRKQQTRRSR